MDPAVEPVTDSAARAARQLRVVYGRLRRRLRAVADPGGLSPAQLSALTRLGADGTSSASALAAAERVRPQSMAATLAALDQDGLISRRPDPEDGRRQLVSLTAAGQEWVAGRRQARQEWLAGVFQTRFTEQERQTVLAALALLERVSES
ncbi:MarR family transcriptional regulator [Streptomyces tateyamensis]|uniref:MarR family transcriptional regulator n=1 Tax=Streptomyces tateyamensis TaxID=565073 RepID=A0A2V4NTB4_9ACTN|nr:MarR family transcriptional regulator [Streptomyces tateyamensis]PYC66090.1 MarR family transcriptional regulator [Streptomyces tateyamensis]